MSGTTGKIGRKELAIIHIARAQLGWSEEEYRHTLKDGFGVSSSAELTSKQADKLIVQFQAAGFRIVRKAGKVGTDLKSVPNTVPQGNWDRLPMLKKIGAILADIGKTDAYADGIARRMFAVDAYRWCKAEQLWKIIAALEYTRNKLTGEGPTASKARRVKKVKKEATT